MRFLKTTISASMVALSLSMARGETSPVQWSDSTMVLDEVSVTAIKNGGSPLSVPGSVTTVSQAQIERLDIVNIKQATSLVPNFYIPDYGSRMTSSIYVRGLGARIDQPVVGLNVDNVPFLNKDNYDFDMADIQRIEVYRGPQSTLYGRNTMAGLVSVYTLSPLSYQGLRLMGQIGTNTSFNGNIGYYFKLKPGLGMSVTLSSVKTDGFFRNGFNGSKTGKEESCGLRWKTVWRLSDVLTAENTASVNFNKQSGYAYQSLETGEINYNDTCYYERTGIADGLTLNWTLPGVTLSSISSFQYINDDVTLDQDFLPQSYFTLSQRRHEWAFTQDFIAKGKKRGYGWLAGAFMFYKRTNMSAPVTFKDDGIRHLIENNANQPGSKYPIRWNDRSFVLNSDFMQPVYGLAVYHRSSLELGRLSLSADIRLDYEHVGLDYHNYTSTSATMWDTTVDPERPYQHIQVDIDERERLNRSFTELTPKLMAEYDFGDISTYVSVAKGYTAGGYNTQMFSDVLQQKLMGKFGISETYPVKDIITYKPEKSWNYEAGVHFRFPRLNMSGSAALFYIDCLDQQLTMFPAGNTTGRIMANAGKTRSYGAELSLRWTPVDRLALYGAYGFTNARFVEFGDGRDDFSGNRVPYAPQNTMYVSGEYTFDFKRSEWMRSLSIHVGARGVGSIYWNEANTVRQPFYVLTDASLTLEIARFIDAEIKAENLLDAGYDVFYFKSVGNEFVQRGLPRRFYGTLRFIF